MSDVIKFPQPDEISYKDRENGFGAYIMMFAGAYFPLPFVEIISSAIYYSYYKKRSRYVSFHAYQSFLAQIPITIVNTAFAVYGIYMLVNYIKTEFIERQSIVYLLTFLAITVLLNIIYIVMSLVISLKAKKGIISYFPIVGEIAFEKLYGANAIEIGMKTKTEVRNHPPE